MNGVSMRSRFQGALVGVAIGDGMGMPVETMKHDEIMKLNNGSGVIGYMDPIQTTFPEVRGLPPASTTDDWQLTAVVARSLIRCGGKFDYRDCAAEHVKEWERDNRLWGRSSRAAIKELAEGRRDPFYEPAVIPGKTGLGNGVIMKITPLALADLRALLDQQMQDCWKLGKLTHGDPRASIGAFAVLHTMQGILWQDLRPVAFYIRPPFLDHLLAEIERMDGLYGEHVNTKREDQIPARLDRIVACLGDERLVRERIGCGFTSIETAPFVIATFLRHPTDFRAGVLEAVNAGGDTDTHASIVGSLIGANVGIEGIPPEWLAQCPATNEAKELADLLYACVEK